jgi:photosystem II stability/assembly factor-like uncharacterized protein
LKNQVLFTLTAGSLLAISLSLTNVFTLPVHAQKATTKSKTPVHHDLNTVSGLSAYLKELKLAKKAAGVKEKILPGTNVRVLPGTGIYEERLARLQERAYPSDRINTDAIFRSINQRERMQPAAPSLQQRARDRSLVTLAATGGGNPNAVGAWEFIGPRNLTVPYTTYYGPANSALTGRVSGIAFHPTDPKTIYIATPIGGIHKTTDGGTTWAAIGDSFPIPFTSSVAVDPNNPNIIYAGLGDHDYNIDTQGWWFGGAYNARQFGGIMRSTDGGVTWDRTMDFLQGCAVNAIVTDPDTPGVVMAAVYGGTAASVYRSTDYGATWSVKTATKSLIVNAEDVEIGVRDASGRRPYYVVGANNRIFRSADKGITWAQITGIGGAGRVRIAASAVSANILYMTSTSDQRVRKGVRNATTGAWTWTDITGNHPQNYGPGSNWSQVPYDYHMQASAHTINGTLQDTLYLGLITISASPGANGTWIDIGRTGSAQARTHNDSHSFAVFPGDSNIMAVGNDGGIYGLTYTTSAGAPTLTSWTFATRWNHSIGITAFHDADFHPTNPNIMLAGTQDNATPAALGDLTNWKNPGAGDGFGSAINPTNPAIQFLTVQGGTIARTGNSWVSGAYITPAYFSESPGFFTWLGIDPTAPGHLYLGTQFLWRYNETTRAWQGHLGNTQLSNGQIRAITVAPSNNQRLYVGTTDGKFWISSNQGASWTQRTGLPNRAFTSIWVNPIDPDHVRVAVGGTGTGHLYESYDAGVTFVNISGSGTTGLPDVPTNAVTCDASSLWVGTDIGVFYSADSGLTWQNATQPLGLPNCEISALKLVPGTGYLMAATYGRGMWRLPVVIDPNYQKGNPNGTGVITIAGATLGGTKAAPTLSLTLRNTGTGNTKNVTVTFARLALGGDPAMNPLNLPLNVGELTNSAQTVAVLNYGATTQPSGTAGLVKVQGTYVRTSDQSVQSFSGNLKVILP